MLKTKILQTLLILAVITACGRNNNSGSSQQAMPTDEKVFVVQEVLQTTKYTYLKVSENQSERWVAVSKLEAMPGDRYYYDKGLPMKDFHSKELNRDFETVDFINNISKTPLGQKAVTNTPIMQAPHGHSGKVVVPKNSDVSIQKSEGELTIAQIFADPQRYANKQVEIKGTVVKVNKSIMGKNWIHLQDGTGHNDKFDLTLTSNQVPPINQVQSFKGTLNLNKDFGAGYFYEVIVEDAEMMINY
ncbi:hypothetical protein SAMN06265379_10639 [Saccharicrinis carchari]|uniref:SH3 domain-containing protein n=1 Tax=Saccharicrinis carchari TaxID=1168039 RepID=A0A521DMP0_SACCC|nr:hypothetical protein [Saccharicrinis carchari]SMO72984.1 hypothetical protein SAMN06265379_10639 [Saccharicrinis carchari]